MLMEECKLKVNCKIATETILDSVRISGKFAEEELGSYLRSFDIAGHQITIYIAEKYFHRITSTLTVTLIIDQTEESTSVEVISGGGKITTASRYVFSTALGSRALGSLGAEKRALKDIIASLQQLGFTEIEDDAE